MVLKDFWNDKIIIWKGVNLEFYNVGINNINKI